MPISYFEFQGVPQASAKVHYFDQLKCTETGSDFSVEKNAPIML